MNIGIFLWVVHDAISKWLTVNYPVFELLLMRSVFSLPLLLLVIRFEHGRFAFTTKRFWLLVVRGFLSVGSFGLSVRTEVDAWVGDAVCVGNTNGDGRRSDGDGRNTLLHRSLLHCPGVPPRARVTGCSVRICRLGLGAFCRISCLVRNPGDVGGSRCGGGGVEWSLSGPKRNTR